MKKKFYGYRHCLECKRRFRAKHSQQEICSEKCVKNRRATRSHLPGKRQIKTKVPAVIVPLPSRTDAEIAETVRRWRIDAGIYDRGQRDKYPNQHTKSCLPKQGEGVTSSKPPKIGHRRSKTSWAGRPKGKFIN